MDTRPATIFIDLDGTCFKHHGSLYKQLMSPVKVLPGVHDKFAEWEKKGYRIVITTGRKESMRIATERQIQEAGLYYDILVMGIGGGRRILINDAKPDGEKSAHACCLTRNKGLEDVQF